MRIDMHGLRANVIGSQRAERFRRRFNLKENPFPGDRAYTDVHDYLHAFLGMLPGPWDDEYAVARYHEAILEGRVPVPRGLELIRREV